MTLSRRRPLTVAVAVTALVATTWQRADEAIARCIVGSIDWNLG